MLGGADNPNGELLSYIIGADNVSSALNLLQSYFIFSVMITRRSLLLLSDMRIYRMRRLDFQYRMFIGR